MPFSKSLDDETEELKEYFLPVLESNLGVEGTDPGGEEVRL